MRESVTLTYAGLELCLYGNVYDGQLEIDRIETAMGLDNIYPLVAEFAIAELNEMANNVLASEAAESELYRGSPDDWKYDREAA